MIIDDQVYIGICANDKMSNDRFNDYLSRLPSDIQNRIEEKAHQKDKQALLLGRLLLLEYAKNLIPDFEWGMVRYSDFGKPYLARKEFVFNISHSDKYVVCSMQSEGLLGVDIEKIKETDISYFKSILHHKEIQHLDLSEELLSEFYKLWTKKEAYTKALGVGLSYPLKELNTLKNKINYKGKIITISQVSWHPQYVLSYATDITSPQLIKQEYSF